MWLALFLGSLHSQTLVTDEREEKKERTEKMIERDSVCLKEREK